MGSSPVGRSGPRFGRRPRRLLHLHINRISKRLPLKRYYISRINSLYVLLQLNYVSPWQTVSSFYPVAGDNFFPAIIKARTRQETISIQRFATEYKFVPPTDGNYWRAIPSGKLYSAFVLEKQRSRITFAGKLIVSSFRKTTSLFDSNLF